MNIFKKILIVLLVIWLSIVGAGLFLPEKTVVSRSIAIDAPKALVFELVSNHRDFQRWSPWAKLDPNMQVNYEGPEKGLGSKSMWQSAHPHVGQGESTYTEYEPYEKATLSLSFEQGGGDAIFILSDGENDSTTLEWQFEQTADNVFGRYIGVLFLDGMLGPMYEQGLQDLKVLAESLPAIVTEEIEYQSGDTVLTGFLAKPLGKPNAPTVLVVHEWWGHNAYARKRAGMLAELGYNAFAIDMYGDGKLATHPKDAMAFMKEATANFDTLSSRFDSAVAYVEGRPDIENDDVAAIGYCFGGAVVLNMARTGRELEGVVSFHGGLASLVPVVEGADVPSLVLNGEADPFISAEHIARFEKDMTEAGQEFKFINYPDALHAFTSKDATEIGEEFGLPLAYNEEADQKSWLEMQTFLEDVFSD